MTQPAADPVGRLALTEEDPPVLVLSRKVDQKIVIGDQIVVTVKHIAGSRVILGFEAPEGIRILRSELVPVANAFAAPSKVTEPAAAPTDACMCVG